MFETMTGFLWFFFIGMALIVGGILFEEKLVALECWICRTVWRLVQKGVRHG